MRRMIVILAILFVLSGCAKSAGEAWFTTPQIPSYELPNAQEILCNQWNMMCMQGSQDYCNMYAQQCVPQRLQAKALVLVNDNAPASDVILARDASIILQNYNAVPSTLLDSEVSIQNVPGYDIVVRILNGDVNILHADTVQFRDLALELQTDLKIKDPRIPISMKRLGYATVYDLCRLVPKAVEAPRETTMEVAIAPAGSNVYLGNLVMGGQTFKLRIDASAKLLRITLPDKTRQDITLDQNMQGVWNHQGKSWRVKVDIQNRKVTFTYP